MLPASEGRLHCQIKACEAEPAWIVRLKPRQCGCQLGEENESPWLYCDYHMEQMFSSWSKGVTCAICGRAYQLVRERLISIERL